MTPTAIIHALVYMHYARLTGAWEIPDPGFDWTEWFGG